MAKKSTFCTNWQKYALQWGVLALLLFFLSGLGAKVLGLETPDPEKYCPFGGLQALTTFLVKGSLPCSMTTMQIMMGIALAAAVIFFSKLFCGYLCPIGSVEDLLKKLREAIGLKAIAITNGSIADKILRIIKYALLFWIVYMTVSASELFCKNLDPYYAVATGFKGEITLWMSLVSLGVVLLLGIVIDRFWCRYICPLGAVSNSLKYWVWLVLLAGICWALNLLGVHIAWIWYLGAYCLAGYLLEILHSRPKLQILGVTVNQAQCSHRCYSCRKNCPYGIDVPSFGNKVTSVDCTLCGECVAACPTKALAIGVKPGESEKCRRFTRFLPAVIAVALVIVAAIAGGKFELPTINEIWGTTENMALETVTIKNLRSVKCYGSSMAFKARMEKVRGVHGVKTFVGSHTVVISYDPAVTTAEKVQAEVFVPSHFRVESPDPDKYPEIKCVTIRTEHMSDKLDLNYLGIQMRLSGKKIFGLESEYDCPLIVRVYMDPAEQADEEWFRQIVEKKTLDMPVHGGGVKSTPVDFEFVRMEKGEKTVPVADFLESMFDPFTAEYNGKYPQGDTTVIRKRSEVYAGQPQFIYEIADQNYEKPIIKRALPYLSNHLSKEEGVIGIYLKLNDELVPSIQVRFASPMTTDRIWELMTMDTWTITYSEDDVRQEGARLKFNTPGRVLPYKTTSR